jgi:hypothetical protein
MQRNFLAQYLQDRGQKEAALVAYTTDDSLDWRFSLVRLDYRLEVQADGTYKPTKEVTAARRSSFLVGQTEPNHTAKKQLLPLLQAHQNPTLDDLEAAFNIESVTKEFFEQYKALFLQVRDEVDTLIATDAVIAADFSAKHIDSAIFAKKLLGQIVFLYFLQKKGWLGVEPGQPWGQGPKDFLRKLLNQDTIRYSNFFNDVLEPLFYDALATYRGEDALYDLPGCPTPCKIPFLNGGLFEPMGGYDWQTTHVLIANKTIQQVLETFDRYNFTVREDEPLEKEVAVDPEMLGKVFENLLEVTDRKAKGAFYTPREIVHYMCQESLINYLDTTLNRQAVELLPPPTQQTTLFASPTPEQLPLTQEGYCERVPRADLERLIREGERAIGHDAQVMQKGSETEAYQFRVPELVRTHAAEIDQALAEIKICDPAIGSGAFPVGMMQEIVKVRGILTTYLAALTPSPSPQGEGGRTPYDFKRHAIQASIYGVDIDPGAVDIAKLRLWLSLVVDEEDYTRIKPLPNLDYKIVCGNSLLGVDPREGVKIYQGNVLNNQQLEQLDRLMIDFFDETNSEQKAQLNREIKALIKILTGDENTFDFKIYFSEVFKHNGGFDIVIGNPPYVRQEKLGSEFKQSLKENFPEIYKGTADIYTYFYGKGVDLLKNDGSIAYITSNKWFRANYGVDLRKFMANRCHIQQIIDFGELPVFEAATFPVIFIAKVGKNNTNKTQFTSVKSLNPPYPDILSLVQQYAQELPPAAIQGSDWMLTNSGSADIFKKMDKVGTPLVTYANNQIYRGVVTGFNKAFVIDDKKRAELIAQDPKNAEIIKPLAVGDDVRKWHIRASGKWLLFIPWHFPLHGDSRIEGASEEAEKAFKDKYPAIYEHLSNYKGELSSRNKSETGIRYEWYALQRCAASYYQIFEKPKIIYPDIAKESRFAFDRKNHYVGNTIYFIAKDDLFLLAILNSSIIWSYCKETLTVLGDAEKGGRLRFFRQFVEKIPIPPASLEDKARIETLVNYILFLAKELKTIPSHGAAMVASANDKLMLNYFEQIVDAIIMELYLPEELHAANKYFMTHLETEKLPKLDEISENAMESLRSIFNRLFKKDHPIRENLFFLDSVPVVRIIRGLK